MTIVEGATIQEVKVGTQRVRVYKPQRDEMPLHRLLQGDATDRDLLEMESVDLTVTSPPYNVGKAYDGDANSDSVHYIQYMDFTRTWLSNCLYWTRDTGRLCVNVALDKNKNGKNPVAADVTKMALDVGWKYHATIIWNEGNISRRTAWGSWMSASAPHIIAPVEVIIVLYKGTWKRKNQGESDIERDEFMNWVLGNWEFPGESAKRIGHEAPFPLELPKRCIKLFSFVGDTILDPFAGSGTTLISAIENSRNALGIELESQYCDLAIQRIEDECEVRLVQSSLGSRRESILNCWKV